MPRHTNPDLTRTWKVHLPATLAGVVEWMLRDPLTQRPIYAARGRLLENCLERWLAEEEGRPPPPRLNLDQLRSN